MYVFHMGAVGCNSLCVYFTWGQRGATAYVCIPHGGSGVLQPMCVFHMGAAGCYSLCVYSTVGCWVADVGWAQGRLDQLHVGRPGGCRGIKPLEFVLSSKGSSQGSSLGQRPKFSLSPPFQCARVIYSWMTSNIGLTTVEFNCVGVYSPTCT